MNKYKIFPNAKINIGLNVYQKAGDGYHEIDSVMSPIDLSDEMDITFYSEIGDLKLAVLIKIFPLMKEIFYIRHMRYFLRTVRNTRRK